MLLAFGRVGPEFRAHATAEEDSSQPAVASDIDGNFVVAYSSMAPDGSGRGIYARRYGAGGVPLGGDFRVNTFTAGDQSAPDVARDADGDFIVVWNSFGQDGSDWGVYAQRYTAAGAPRGGEFRVNTFTAGSQSLPAVAMDFFGDFVVTWQSSGQDASGDGIFAQRYVTAGEPVGGEFLVNTTTAGDQSYPSVAMSAEGTAVIAWVGAGGDRAGPAVFARRYDRSGEPLSGPFPVTSTGAIHPDGPAVATDFDGDFVVAWWEQSQYDGADLYAQRYTSAGTALPLIGVSSGTGSPSATSSPSASIAMNAAGDFIVAWEGAATYCAGYSAAGQSGGGPTQINTTGARGDVPSVAAGGGEFVIAWAAGPSGISARRVDVRGNAIGDEFAVDPTVPSSHSHSSVAIDSLGNSLVAWQVFGQDGSGWGVYAQRYGPAGQRLGQEFRVATATLGDQLDADVAMNPEGQFVIVWAGAGRSGAGIYAKTYFPYGEPLSPEVFVGAGSLPSVAIDAHGNFVVGWMGNGIQARCFNEAASPLGPSVHVSTTTRRQWDPSIAMDADGDFVVTWMEEYSVILPGLFGRRFDASSQPAGDPFHVNTRGSPYSPHVAMDADGDFVVAWHSHHVIFGYDWGFSAGEVIAQRYAAAGQPEGAPFTVNNASGDVLSPDINRYSSIAMDPDGDFVVAWQSYRQDGVPRGIYARRYNAAGLPEGDPFRVNATPGNRIDPSVALNAAGELVVAWTHEGNQLTAGIYAQRFGTRPAPRVTAVFVGSTMWTHPFGDFLATLGLGDSKFGYALPDGPAQLDAVPWSNIDRISVRFSDEVLPSTLHLSLDGADPVTFDPDGFTYDAITHTASWTLSKPLRNDRRLLRLDGTAQGVINTAGFQLDGDWTDGVRPFPSGDGSPGGDFRFRIDVLPGDADRSGAVLANDCSAVKRRFFTSTTHPGSGDAAYSIFHDFDGSGTIVAADFSEVRKRFFTRLPDSQQPAVAAQVSAGPPGVTRDLFGSSRVLADTN